MKRYGVLFISTLVLFVGAVYFSLVITLHLNDYRDKKNEIAEYMNLESRLGRVNNYFDLSFLGFGENDIEKYNDLTRESEAFYGQAVKEAYFIFGLVILFVLGNYLINKSKENAVQLNALTLIFASMAFLYLGLQSPFMELEAFTKDLEISLDTGFFEEELGDMGVSLEGRSYHFYQNKSVLQLIGLLYTGGNIPVALCLLIFSIVFPIVKLISSILIVFNPKSEKSLKAISVVEKIGKWSMADVFTAAIFLAFFAFSNMNVGVNTGATTLIGTYFFLTFVVLSIFSGGLVKRFILQNHGKLIKPD